MQTTTLTIQINTNAKIPPTLADTIAEQVEAHLISSTLFSCVGSDFLNIKIDGDQIAEIDRAYSTHIV
jgi:hypothetical protein